MELLLQDCHATVIVLLVRVQTIQTASHAHRQSNTFSMDYANAKIHPTTGTSQGHPIAEVVVLPTIIKIRPV